MSKKISILFIALLKNLKNEDSGIWKPRTSGERTSNLEQLSLHGLFPNLRRKILDCERSYLR